jgi:ornithine cyclodeaminase/alanine dehydrogenase
MALVESLPALALVRCYDISPESMQSFVAEMGAMFPTLQFVECHSASAAVQGADVVVSAIPIVVDPKPDLDEGMLKEGGLAVALDYDAAWTSAAMAGCDKFCSDDIGQLLSTKDHGVYFSGIPDVIHADLGELAAGLKPGRENEKERIFSLNMGIAVEDMVTAKALYQRALEREIGVRLPL